MQAFLDANASWLTVYRLPAYAPDLNPAEGVWSNLRRAVYNLAAAGRAHLHRVVHGRLAHIGARPALLDGFIAETGLTPAAG